MLPEYRHLFDDVGRTKDPASNVLPEMFDRHMFVCESYNATFSLRISYQDFQHRVTGNVE